MKSLLNKKYRWLREQDAFPLSLEKTNLVLVEVSVLALDIIVVFKTPEKSNMFYGRHPPRICKSDLAKPHTKAI